jgi:hypothetical protein
VEKPDKYLQIVRKKHFAIDEKYGARLFKPAVRFILTGGV